MIRYPPTTEFKFLGEAGQPEGPGYSHPRIKRYGVRLTSAVLPRVDKASRSSTRLEISAWPVPRKPREE